MERRLRRGGEGSFTDVEREERDERIAPTVMPLVRWGFRGGEGWVRILKVID